MIDTPLLRSTHAFVPDDKVCEEFEAAVKVCACPISVRLSSSSASVSKSRKIVAEAVPSKALTPRSSYDTFQFTSLMNLIVVRTVGIKCASNVRFVVVFGLMDSVNAVIESIVYSSFQ